MKLQIWTPERTLINIFIPRWVTLVCRSDCGVVYIEKQEGVNTSSYLFIRLETKVQNCTFEGNCCVSSCTDQIQNKHDNKEISLLLLIISSSFFLWDLFIFLSLIFFVLFFVFSFYFLFCVALFKVFMISFFFSFFYLVSLFEIFVVSLFFFWFCFFFLSFVFVCVF